MNLEAGVVLLRQMCAAIGIDPEARPITRIVLDVGITDVPRITIYEVGQAEQKAALATSTRDAFEADGCVVVVERTT